MKSLYLIFRFFELFHEWKLQLLLEHKFYLIRNLLKLPAPPGLNANPSSQHTKAFNCKFKWNYPFRVGVCLRWLDTKARPEQTTKLVKIRWKSVTKLPKIAQKRHKTIPKLNKTAKSEWLNNFQNSPQHSPHNLEFFMWQKLAKCCGTGNAPICRWDYRYLLKLFWQQVYLKNRIKLILNEIKWNKNLHWNLGEIKIDLIFNSAY